MLYVVSVFGSGGKKVSVQFWFKYVFTTKSTIQLWWCVSFLLAVGNSFGVLQKDTVVCLMGARLWRLRPEKKDTVVCLAGARSLLLPEKKVLVVSPH